MKQLYIHIGTHKTGSTSLQRWLLGRKAFLARMGYLLYQGIHIADNHIELYLASMRYDRDSFAKQTMAEVSFDEQYTSNVAERVNNFIATANSDKLIFTTEGLSLIRHDDELAKLKSLFDRNQSTISFILNLRNKKDYLESYRRQLLKKPGRTRSSEYWSALYVEDDTWLTDYDQLRSAYIRNFPQAELKIIDYDHELKTAGNIIPSFAQAIGLQLSEDELKLVKSYWHNATISPSD